MSVKKNIVVIGGGAAGFFAAINLALRKPNYDITILEKTNKLLSKVKVSGGGRCNVTNHCFDNSELVKNYPRGNKELQQVFSKFSVQDTIEWFRQQGVVLKTEDDGRMFPYSNSSETIVDCFLDLANKLNIKIKTQCEVISIKKNNTGFLLETNQINFQVDAIICALGGHNKTSAYSIIKDLGISIDEPIPSLFTLNFPNEVIKKELQGISVQNAQVKIANSKLNYSGPVLITHWGLSGPAVLKLSAFAAKEFFDLNYRSTIIVNWVYPLKPNEIEIHLKNIQKEKHKALPHTKPLFDLPRRLWEFLCHTSGIDNTKPWAEISNKQLNKLTENLCNSNYSMEGKTTFKEEFVTCGGVNLKEIDFKTMQSKQVPNLFFCGEVLNIDGITGGFNFQSAWSTAWICAENCNP
ncbi:MAG: NAD(P)/FAD-dependent oxidoreductase [Bacteroidota bacterium]|nr:NAD(P)/FAD-dependent oxidoreductase [Bacteroidota bacterium]MDP3145184.1 NAD(P)/FAD-dependent oxidoreductase [Bacteroidota bacterium]